MNNKMISLGGMWKIAKDENNSGKENGWHKALPETALYDIVIPDHIPNQQWTMQLSYANIFPKYHGFVWYYKTIDQGPSLAEGEHLLLEFERAAYLCRAYLNGVYLGEHAQHEKSFSFDATRAYRPGEENLLAVQCFEPRATGAELDGISLWKLPNSCWAQTQAHMLGAEDSFCLECVGGILGSVHLRAVPQVHIEELYVRTFWESGEVQVHLEIINLAAPCTKEVSVLLSAKKSGKEIETLCQCFDIPTGRSEFVLNTKIENHQLWELDAPFLYLATAGIDGHCHITTNFGFKDFRIQNGYFFLNGKRIFLKGAHATPSAAYAISMKALGFNAIRTIAREFPEELFNLCDELGLLVLDAAATGWGMFMHENTRQQIEDCNENIIRKHRNHPCVAAYYLVNETEDKPELFSCYVEALPKLRALVPDTLFLLHSGRWDRDITLGSASNPRSNRWDTYLGAEGIIDYPNRELPIPFDGYQDPAMGDIHIYMHVPIAPKTRDYLRKIGQDAAPVFISESGIASQLDIMGEYLPYSDQNLSVAITTQTAKTVWDETEAFLDFYDLRQVYPLACDISRATEKLNGIQRTHLYNIYRSNPKINGFSFTSFGVSHEGTLQGNMVIKDSLAYAIQQGHEPLRWALFSSDRTVYANKPFEIEAVLCNEDVLKPGNYTAQAYIRGKRGCAWKKDFVVNYPENGYGNMPPLAFSALKETVSLPAGEYVFSVRLTQGNVAYDGDLPITVAIAAEEQLDAKIAVCCLSEDVCIFLREHGIVTEEVNTNSLHDLPKLVLVGTPKDITCMELLQAFAVRGCNVVFLTSELFAENPEWLKKIAGSNAYVRNAHGTIYHHDHITISHSLFDKLNDAGVLEADRFGIVYPREIFCNISKPDKTVCAAIRIDSTFTTPGLTVGEYVVGNGRYVLNTFPIAQALNKHPYADQLLINMIKSYT